MQQKLQNLRKNKTTLKLEALKTILISDKEFDKIVDQKKWPIQNNSIKLYSQNFLNLSIIYSIDLLLKL